MAASLPTSPSCVNPPRVFVDSYTDLLSEFGVISRSDNVCVVYIAILFQSGLNRFDHNNSQNLAYFASFFCFVLAALLGFPSCPQPNREVQSYPAVLLLL